jgi:bleomycin hydrolase
MQIKQVMKRTALVFVIFCCAAAGAAQESFNIIKDNPATSVKNQAATNTCWSFSTLAMVEGQCLQKTKTAVNISEMYVVRHIYLEKARNYILRLGNDRFDEGAMGHDAIRAMAKYGAVPEELYSGLLKGQTTHDHSQLIPVLKSYLDSILKLKPPIPASWMDGFTKRVDDAMGGTPPPAPDAYFTYQGKQYSPKTFARDVLKFNAADYAFFTSFTHHPFNTNVVVEVPDNFSNGQYFNIPLNDLMRIAEQAVMKGHHFLWDADVSNPGWSREGHALLLDEKLPAGTANLDVTEKNWSAEQRQQLFENLVTQDDHLMDVSGIITTPGGKKLFKVKNSWGEKRGAYNGYWYVSFPYFAINTIGIVVPKAALDLETRVKYKISGL